MFFWGTVVVSSRQLGPKTERSFAKGLKREARNCQQGGVKRARRPRGTVWMKVRNVRGHTVLTDTLKTETSNFVLNPRTCSPAWCSIAGSNLLQASGRGDFPLEITWVLTPFPQSSFRWKYKPISTLCTHAFHYKDSKDTDIPVLDGWM